MTESATLERTGRTERLRQATKATHERLDARVMAGRPFESRDRYARFLAFQRDFHCDIDALYRASELDGLLPDMAQRRRLALIEADMDDLNLEATAQTAGPVFVDGAPIDVPTSLGWLYVAEGSNLGAAFLLKAAAALGLSVDFGARHLAGHPQGRGLHWKTFTHALDAVALAEPDEARSIAGAEAAFARVHELAERHFG